MDGAECGQFLQRRKLHIDFDIVSTEYYYSETNIEIY
jgi:hypothetical protein